jgi:MFS family permease
MVMDASAINVILPEIAEDFSVSLGAVSWVTIIAGLVVSSTLLPFGKLADLTGRRKMQIIGMGLFAAGTLVCFFSTNISILISGRVISSFGASMLQAVTMAIVLAVFPKKERGKGLGLITFAVGIGGLAGPIIGSQVSEFIGWKYIFLIMFFPTFFGLLLSYFILKDNLIGSPESIKIEYDKRGALYSALFIISLIINIVNPFYISYSSPIYWILWALCIGLIVLFIKSQVNNPLAMFNLKLFSDWRFSFAVGSRLMGFISNGPFWFIIPFYATIVLKYNISLTGILIFLNAIGMSIAGSIGGRLSDKFGVLKFIIIGQLSLSLTWVLLIIVGSEASFATIATISLFQGVSNGLWMAPNTVETLENIETKYQGLISAFNALVRNVGSVIGISISTTLITFILIKNGLNVQIGDLKTGTQSEILILSDAMGYSFICSAIFGIIALILTMIGRIKVSNH